MDRIDVGGNRAGTQTGYTAYGYSAARTACSSRASTRPKAPAAPASTSTTARSKRCSSARSAQGAEMPTPGVQSQMLGKSGGNKFQGEIYQDYETNGMIATTSRQRAGQVPVRPGDQHRRHPRCTATRLQKYRDTNLNVGGPIKKDKVWWYFSYRNQKTVGRPAEFHRRRSRGTLVRHQAVEPLGQDHVSDQPEQQVDRLLPVGPEGRSRTACRRARSTTRSSARR